LERKQISGAELGEKQAIKIPNFTWNFTASSTSRHIVKILMSEHGMEVVVSVVNFIPSHGLHCHQFQSFCRKMMLNIGTACTDG
jgi:hypothetical protein